MLTDIKEILSKAKNQGYGVCSTSPVFADLIAPIIQACQDQKSPVILSVTENQIKYNDIENIGPELVYHAQRASVPVAVILDHGKSMEVITKAIRMGFNAIMFDGSDLPLEENIKQTKYICEMAHHFNLSVEGELGSIGGAEGTTVTEKSQAYQYTEAATALDFVQETKVDILAVAIGNVHGVTTFRPALDFQRLNEIKTALAVPLAMHGSSGIEVEDIKKAIANGISKVNFYSDMSKNMVHAVEKMLEREEKFVNFPLLMKEAQKTAYDTISKCSRIYSSAGRA